MRIDVHCHCFPKAFMLELKALGIGEVEIRSEPDGQETSIWRGSPLPVWNTEQRLHEMREHGVDMEALLLPLVYVNMGEHSAQLCSLVNDFFASLCREFPESFLAYSVVPINNIDQAIAELNRATSVLGLKAVLLPSNADGKYMSEPYYFPLWEELNRLKRPVMVHPLSPPGQPRGPFAAMIGFPMETTMVATKLTYAGIFEKFNEIKLLLGHLGGAIPFLSRRLDFAYDAPYYRENFCPDLEIRPSEALRRLFLETSLAYDDLALNCAIGYSGIEHIMFGSNHGSGAVRRGLDLRKVTIDFLELTKLGAQEREAIFSDNAKRFFGILGDGDRGR